MIRPASTTNPAAHDADSAAGHVCPFCGLTREITPQFDPASPCPRCTLSDTPQTRNATKLRVGPWHVRQVRNPWAPGMRFETLLALVKRGQVTRDSIVRGPTTFQLWKRASEVRGLSREFGLCYSCLGEVDPQAKTCPHCNRMQDPPANPDALLEARDASPVAAVTAPAVADSARSTPSAAVPGDSEATANEPASLEIASSAPMPAGSDPADLLTVEDEPQGRTDSRKSPAPQGNSRPQADDPTRRAAPLEPPVGIKPPQAEKRAPSAPGPASVRPGASRIVEQPDVSGRAPRPPQPRPSAPPAARSALTPAAGKPQMEKPLADKQKTETPLSEEAPPSKDRPLIIRPRTPGAEDALLTPQELAAAFQLDFAPQAGERRAGSRMAGGLLVVVLLAAGAAALLYLRPDFRAGAMAWTSRAWSSAKQFVTSRTVPAENGGATGTRASSPARPAAPAATRQRPIAISPPAAQQPATKVSPAAEPESTAVTSAAEPQSSATSPSLPPTVMETPDPSQRPADEASTGDLATGGAGDASTQPLSPPGSPVNESVELANVQTAPVEPVVRPAPTTTSQDSSAAPPIAASQRAPLRIPSAPVPAPAPAVTKKVPDSANAYEEARQLLGKALDAEENQDYVEAVRCYEAIKRLPVDARAMGIDVRLARARKLIQ